MIFFIPILYTTVSPNDNSLKTTSRIRITFGSCANFIQNNTTDIFKSIIEYKPDLFIWLGDFAYIDNKFLLLKSYLPDLSLVRSRFMSTKLHPSYQKMISSFPIIGIWDDHDYGQNDGDKYNPHKEIIQQMFLDMLDVPKDSKRRTQQGIYFAYKIAKQIKMILLDVRYNKESWFDANQDMLGEEQWDWLEKELNDNSIEIFFIMSGTQIIPDDRFLPESWYIPSKERLYSLIKKLHKKVVFLSGDVHYGEIIQHPCSCQKLGYPLVEMTSSGLTHYFGDGLIIKDKLVKYAFPDTFNKHDQRFFGYNFGSIEIELDENDKGNSKITLQIRDLGNNVKLERILYFKELNSDNNFKCMEENKEKCILETERREVRFLKNAFVKLLDFDLYVYFMISCILLIVSGVILIIYVLLKRINRCFKQKKE